MKDIKNLVLFICFLFVYFLATFFVCNRPVYLDKSSEFILLTIFLLFPIIYLILYLSHSYNITFLVITFLITIFYIADSLIYSVRNKHIVLYDFFHIRDAIGVYDRYNLRFSTKILAYLIVFIILNLLSYKVFKSRKFKQNKLFLGLLFCSIIYILPLNILKPLKINPYPKGVNFNSNVVFQLSGIYSLYYQVINSSINISSQDIKDGEKILSSYSEIDGSGDIKYICILNESFTDYSLIGKTKFKDPLSNIHSRDDIFEGKLYTSVFGGNTCDTEFEFLTGCSLHFFPDMYSPFTFMNLKNINSISREFKNSYAIHPFFEQEYNRLYIYNSLGFKDFISGEDFYTDSTGKDYDFYLPEDVSLTGSMVYNAFGDKIDYVRGLVSDKECFNKIVDTLDNKDTNFIYAVTIQNHGGYELGLDSYKYTDNSIINEYLECLSLSDDAFCNLIDTLKDRDDKIVVMMYGDHQPYLNTNIEDYVEGWNNDTKYCTPYLVWSNFGVDIDNLLNETSVNYLTTILKEVSNSSLTSFDNFKLDYIKIYPVITRNFVKVDNKFIYRNDDSLDLSDYEKVQKSLYK